MDFYRSFFDFRESFNVLYKTFDFLTFSRDIEMENKIGVFNDETSQFTVVSSIFLAVFLSSSF